MGKVGSWLSYIGITLLMLVFILWTYIEPNFWDKYGDDSAFLWWTFYLFPWVVIFLVSAHKFGWLKRWFR
jgi:hypothetical protein